VAVSGKSYTSDLGAHVNGAVSGVVHFQGEALQVLHLLLSLMQEGGNDCSGICKLLTG